MKKTLILIILILAALPALPQRTADYGASVGVLTYFGEKNPNNSVFYQPGPAAQVFYRYNFNPRQAVRANLLGGYVMPLGSLLGELGVTYEFNFLPYSTFRGRRVDYTPYIAGGAALSVMSSAGPFCLYHSLPVTRLMWLTTLALKSNMDSVKPLLISWTANMK